MKQVKTFKKHQFTVGLNQTQDNLLFLSQFDGNDGITFTSSTIGVKFWCCINWITWRSHKMMLFSIRQMVLLGLIWLNLHSSN